MNTPDPSRRAFLQRSLLAASAWLAIPGALANELTQTPAQTEGPFYPDSLPLDTDNDLLILNDSLTPAIGQITHLSGRLLDHRGDPVRNALIEIWQADGNGIYRHSQDRDQSKRDANFQSYGRFLTSSTGEYYFRTIKPVPYPGRTPHIHFKISRKSQHLLTTQCYIQGHELNATDSIFRNIRDTRQRQSVEVNFTPLPQSRIGELNARFDVVLGLTPNESQDA
jgi:protocatechuate 3,4-dioxygenase beta subunit